MQPAPRIDPHDPAPAPTRPAVAARAAFGRLNPDFGLPLDSATPSMRRRAWCREDNLARGWRVVLAELKENGGSPQAREQVVRDRAHHDRQPGQRR